MPDEHFPLEQHRAMLAVVENPALGSPEAAWLSLIRDVIGVAARDYYSWGEKGGLWKSQEESHSFFLDAILFPPLIWQIENTVPGSRLGSRWKQIPYSDIKLGHLTFDQWRAERLRVSPAQNLTDEQFRGEYADLRTKWERWIKDHPLRQAWDKREEGGDARMYLVRVVAKQAVRDQLSPLSPRRTLSDKLRKTLLGSPGWFREMDKDWFTLDTDEAARWPRGSSFSGTEYACGIAIETGTKRHSHFPGLLPSRVQIRRVLHREVFAKVKNQLPFEQLLDFVQAKFRVPNESVLIQIDEPITGGDSETVGSMTSDPHAATPGDNEWPEATVRVAAELLLLISAGTIKKTKQDVSPKQPNTVEGELEVSLPILSSSEIETMLRRLDGKDPALVREWCSNGKRTGERTTRYFLRVWLWLERPTKDGGTFTHALYQSDTGMKTSTFGDWKKKAEPVIEVAVLRLSKSRGWPAIKNALRFMAQLFSNLKPESVHLGHLNNEDEIVFDPPPEETGDESDPEEA